MYNGEMFLQGDYEYIYTRKSSGEEYLSVQVHDNSKVSYEDMPSNVTYDGNTYPVKSAVNCFYHCSELVSSPKLSTNLVNMQYCYHSCSKLTAPPTIPKGVTNMYGCFYRCSALATPPVLPKGLENLNDAFYKCESLTTAPAIPSTVTNMDWCFCDSALTSVPSIFFPSNLISAEFCLRGTNISSPPIIPDKVTSLRGLFWECSNLTTPPVIPESVTNLDSCFYGCTSMTELPRVIPKNVTTMNQAFRNYGKINAETAGGEIIFAPSPEIYEQSWLRLVDSDGDIRMIVSEENYNAFVDYFEENPSQKGKITLMDNSLIVNDDYLFISDTKSLKVIYKNKTTYSEIPERIAMFDMSVESLDECFRGCDKLINSPAIPNSVKNMRSIFSGCTSLVESPIIPSSVTNMFGAFYRCERLKIAPVIPDNVGYLSDCFYACFGLTTPPPKIPSTAKILHRTFSECMSLISVPILSEGIQSLEECFNGCSSLEEAPTIPSTVTNMASTFSVCSSLQTAPVIPNSVTDLSETFYNCRSLKTPPVIPEGVTTMEDCFGFCTALESPPIIPASVENVDGCFTACQSLKNAPVLPSVNSLKETFSRCESLITPPEIPSTVQNMNNTFSHCISLTSAPILPDTVTILDACFYECKALSVAPIIPESAISMRSCFAQCPEIETAPSIPASVKDISNMFSGCTSLSGNIVVHNGAALISYTNAFKGTTNPIFIIEPSPSSIWKQVASTFGNVHYGLNDAAIITPMSILTYRVDSDGSENSKINGEYIYIKVDATIKADTIPFGTAANIVATKVKEKKSSSSTYVDVDATFTSTQSDGIITAKCWYLVSDFEQRSIQIPYSVHFSVADGAITKDLSDHYTQVVTIPKAYALLNAYHDPDSGAEGIAFGTFATTTTPQFLVDLPAHYKQTVDIDKVLTITRDIDLLVDKEDAVYKDSLLYAELEKMGVGSYQSETITKGSIKNIIRVLAERYNDTVNHIVEEGTYGIWGYRKWSNYVVECLGLHTGTYDISTVYGGSIYYTSADVPLPENLFCEAPKVIASRQGVTPYGLVSVSPNAVTKDTVSIYIINSGAAFNGAEIGASIYAKGTWGGKIESLTPRAERRAEDTGNNYVHDIENAIDGNTNTAATMQAYAAVSGSTSTMRTGNHYTYADFYYDLSSIPVGALITRIEVKAYFAKGGSGHSSGATGQYYYYIRLINGSKTLRTASSSPASIVYTEPIPIEDIDNIKVSAAVGAYVRAPKKTGTYHAYSVMNLREVSMAVEYEMRGPDYVPPVVETTETES